jgi:chromosomal replication initiator protein
MTGSSRRVHISHARQIAMYLSTELTRHSVAEVGRRFRKDHTTVLHAIKAVRARCETDDQEAFDVALLRERLTG